MMVKRSLAALCLASCIAAPVMAAVPWTTSSGSSDTITYSGGQTENGHYTGTSPSVGSDTFIFTPSGFSLSETGGVPYDAASFVVTAKSGQTLSQVTARVSGDYSLLDGSPPTSIAAFAAPTAGATATLTLTNVATSAVVTRIFNFGTAFANPDGGIFSSSVTAALPAGWTSAQVNLATNLTATADNGSTSFVQVKGAVVDFDTVHTVPVVPLPPALLAAIPGIAVAYIARRRAKRS